MLEHSERYIAQCIDKGILTESAIRKYPLRAANIAIVLKAYAIDQSLPYKVDTRNYNILEDWCVYLTDEGLTWLFNLFQAHTLPYLRSVFQFVFMKATEKDLTSLATYEGTLNFRGEDGVRPKIGTKQAAMLVRRFSAHGQQVYRFATIREAREQLFLLLRFYPPEQFTLYRLREQRRDNRVDRFKEEIPLLINTTPRGVAQ